MNKLLSAALAILFFTVTTSVVLAQTTTTTSKTPLERAEALKTRLETAKKKVEDKMERIASREANFNKFKDQKKAQAAERINAELANINQRKTTELSHKLDKLTEILGRVSERAKDSTVSSTLVNEAISKAQTALDSAKAAVATQQAKSYSIVDSTETTVRADAKSGRNSLFKDLKATFQAVLSVRDAIGNIYTTVASKK